MNVNPFTLFPKELWEMMLRYLLDDNPAKNCKDVLSVMHAYPVFEKEFASLKEVCLIIQVLSILEKDKDFWEYGYRKEIISLRLINKSWCRALDYYLNSQSIKILNEFVDDFTINSRSSGDGTEVIVKFMEVMKEHPASRNPFIANKRLLIIEPEPFIYGVAYDDNQIAVDFGAQEKLMEELMKLLKKYGRHIWNLQFGFSCSFIGLDNQSLFWTKIDKILELVPNLKYLRLANITDSDDFGTLPNLPESAFECVELSLPDLPRLENLYVSFCPYGIYQNEVNLWSNLVKRYASNLKLLRLEPMYGAEDEHDVFKFVEMPPSVSFPCLKQLIFRDCSLDEKSISYVFDHLLNIHATNIETIKLPKGIIGSRRHECTNDITNPKKTGWKSLLQKLKRFPALKRFKTNYCHLGEEDLSAKEDSHLSLEYLHLTDYLNVTYKMLLCFPNLIHLKIHSAIEPTVQDFSVNTEVNIREEIQTGQMFNSNIWELLPKLKTVSLLSDSSSTHGIRYLSKPFTRENYEKIKETLIEVGNESFEFYPLRQDISRYLTHVACRHKQPRRGKGCYCHRMRPRTTYNIPNGDKEDRYLSDDGSDWELMSGKWHHS